MRPFKMWYSDISIFLYELIIKLKTHYFILFLSVTSPHSTHSGQKLKMLFGS